MEATGRHKLIHHGLIQGGKNMSTPLLSRRLNGKVKFSNMPLLKDWVSCIGSPSGIIVSPYTPPEDPDELAESARSFWMDDSGIGRIKFQLDEEGCTDCEDLIRMMDLRDYGDTVDLWELDGKYMHLDPTGKILKPSFGK